MSWLYSRVLVEEYLGDNCLDGEQSVPLSGNPTQQAYCAPDKIKDFSRISRFGMTFKPLTESRGEELLMLYLEDFRVRTLVALEREQESKANEAECGRSSQESLAKYNPSTSLWRTAQCSLLEDLEQSLEIFPKWGSMRNGECYPQPMLEQTISENESGFWATPTRCDYKGTTGTANFQSRKKQFQDLTDGEMVIGTIYPNPITYEAMMGWPLGWTDLNPSATDKSLCAPQQPLNYLERD